MGKTIEELFKTKVLSNGKTAEKTYDIRNSKETPINSYNPLLDLPFKGASAIRKTLSNRKGETRLEEETTGLRVISKLSAPVIYGVDTFRLNNQKTDMVEIMKNATNPTGGSNGIIGNATNKIKLIGQNIASKIGLEFPENLIPTKITLNQSFKEGKESDTMITLSAIKNGKEGNLIGKAIGKVLASSVKGPVKDIPNKLLGAGIDLLKDEVKKALYGSPKEAAQNLAKKSKEEVQYNSSGRYSETVAPNEEDTLKRNDLSSILIAKEKQVDASVNKLMNSSLKLKYEPKAPPSPLPNLGGIINLDTSRFNIGGKISTISDSVAGKLSGARKLGQQTIASGLLTVGDIIPGSTEKITKTSTVDASADDVSLRNDLSSKLEALLANGSINGNQISRDDVSMNQYSTKRNNETSPKVSMRTKLGIDSAIKSDYLNEKLPYELGQNETRLKLQDGTYLDDYDFIPLKFKSIATGKTVSFRAIISGVSETVSPSWDSAKFIGTPFNHYTYSGIERSLTFNFKVYSTTPIQHIAAWQRINFLTSLAYPQGYAGGIGARAPFIQFTLGNLYKNRECFIESLSYTIDDNSPWHVGMTEASGIADDAKFSINKEETSIDNYKLPKFVDVSITVKLLEAKYNTSEGYLYGFDKLPRSLRGNKPYSTEESSKNSQIAGDINNSSVLSFGNESTTAGAASQKNESDADNPSLSIDKIKPKFDPASIIKLERKDLAGIKAPVSIDVNKLPTIAPLRQNPDVSKGNFIKDGTGNYELWVKEDDKKYVATVYQAGLVKEKTRKFTNASKAIDGGRELFKKYQ